MKQKIALLLLFLSVSIFGESKESYYDKVRKEMVNVIERDVDTLANAIETPVSG